MKFLLLFAITLATVSASKLTNTEIKEDIAVVFPAPEDGRPIANLSVADHANYNVTSKAEAEGRITNGYFARQGQIPYQASLSIKLNTGYGSFCGGSLIGKNWVLSAAHCTINAQYVTVFLGSIRINSGEATKYTVYRNNIINHSGYTTSNVINDISLLRIPTVRYTARIQPIRLPSLSGKYDSYAGYNAIASGWGQTENGGLSYSLKWARMEVITNRQCASVFGWWIQPSHVCIDTRGGISTCFGDSGGPLVLESSKILIGVTSFLASRDCLRGDPAAFTRVTSFLQWIKHHTGIYY